MLLTMFVLFGVFAPGGRWLLVILSVHVTLCLSIMVHWLLNDNDCVLTQLESRLRHVDRNETLLHKLLAPILKTDDDLWFFVTSAIFVISVTRLYCLYCVSSQ